MNNKTVEMRLAQNCLPKTQMIRFAQIGYGRIGLRVRQAVELELNREMFDVQMEQKNLTLTLVLMKIEIFGFTRMKNQI